MTYKNENKIKEEYETQVKIPKPILIEIFEFCGLENFLKISLISKQFYFLLKSDHFWLKILSQKTDLTQSQVEEQRKTKSLKEIYLSTFYGWDVKASHRSLTFKTNVVRNNDTGSPFAAVSKKNFISGKENVLFVFDYFTETLCASCGVIKEGR